MDKQTAYRIIRDPQRATAEQVRDMARTYTSLTEGVEELNRAIKNGGPLPDPSQSVMKRQRREWPALWSAIDRIRET